MACNLHSRLNSLPANSHPMIDDIENHLRRLKSSVATSASATSIYANLARLGKLQESINKLIQMPSIQQAISHEQSECWKNELLEGSLCLVDLCGFSRDIVYLINESVQELESSIRRNRSETSTINNINTYVASRKNIVKKVNKYNKNFKNFNQNSTSPPEKNQYLNDIARMLKETEVLNFAVLKYVVFLVSGENERSRQRKMSFISKFSHTSRVHSEVEEELRVEDFCFLNINKSQKNTVSNMLKQLKASEMSIQELEEGLEALFRNLLKTRVSLLNIPSH